MVLVQNYSKLNSFKMLSRMKKLIVKPGVGLFTSSSGYKVNKVIEIELI